MTWAEATSISPVRRARSFQTVYGNAAMGWRVRVIIDRAVLAKLQ
jgi:hypothetical protein